MEIERELQKRNLPNLLIMNNGEAVTTENWELRKQELIDSLSRYIYGYTPPAPKEVRAILTGTDRYRKFGGKAKTELFDLSFDTPGGEFTFPVRITVPTKCEKPPVIVHIGFSMQYPVPEEEIIDNGFALVQFHHHTVQPDDIHPDNYFANFTEGLGAKYIGNRKREKTEWGKDGLVGEMPSTGKALLDGEIGFHVREGGHFFSREDWQHFMHFFKKHM